MPRWERPAPFLSFQENRDEEIVTSLKETARKLYFGSKLFRHMARWLIRHKRSSIDFSHILSFGEEQTGPVYRDEALFLFALTRILLLRTIVEFGFKTGHRPSVFWRPIQIAKFSATTSLLNPRRVRGDALVM